MNLINYINKEQLFDDAIKAHLNSYPTLNEYYIQIGSEYELQTKIATQLYNFLDEYNLNPSIYSFPKQFRDGETNIWNNESNIVDKYISDTEILICLTKDHITVYELLFNMGDEVISGFETHNISEYKY